MGQVGPDLAFFVSSGFASSRQYFSPAFQEQSNFRHLGEDVVNSGETYVVAFARKPEEGAVTGENAGGGRRKYLLIQGIAWVDKRSFQILLKCRGSQRRRGEHGGRNVSER